MELLFFFVGFCRVVWCCFPTAPPSWMCQIECSLGELKEGNTRHWENLGDEALKKCANKKLWVGDSRSQLLQCIYLYIEIYICIYMLYAFYFIISSYHDIMILQYYSIMLLWFLYTQSVYFWANDVTTLACRFPDICNLRLMNSI